MRAIQITELGGPEVLTLTELPDPQPGPGQVLVEVTGVGVNYADTHLTEGSYLTRTELPVVPGSEVAGRTPDGRRVVGLTGGGAYAEKAVVPEALAVDVPEGIGDGEALALLVQGLTAWHLLRTCARLQPGESVVVQSATGGTGGMTLQLARVFGAGRVIATASSQEKRDLAVKLGADAAVSDEAEGYAERLIEANGGKRVDVVLDAVGGPVFDAAQHALAPFGRLVTFGAASRVSGSPIDPVRVMKRNLVIAGFWLTPILGLPGMYREPMAELLQLAADGRIHPVVGGEYPLAEAPRAHEDLLARRSTGKLVLKP